ncbi:MAG: hypothetical protein CL726_02290 [Chloroflexi bacterium]|jgi:hypothetical protein|nr:hypothetical protein [Chloroflexota bacterium]|tara:strand:- start:8749 stop:9489 length:741 start_codon:yes stop_codon:yes gene_type:complete
MNLQDKPSHLLHKINRVHDIAVELDPEEVWRCLGPSGGARESLHADVLKATDFAANASQPRGISRVLNVESAKRGKVHFESGYIAEGKQLPHLFEGAEGAVFMITTAGAGVETEVASMMERGDHIEGVVLDAGGSAVAINAAEQMQAQIMWEVEQAGYKVGPPITPGTEPWDLEGQLTMFDVLVADEIDVTLLDSRLMYPQKTQSRIIPFGRELRLVNDPDEAPCRTCRARRCPMRIEEYQGVPGE